MRLLVSGATRAVRRLAQLYPGHLGVLLTPKDRSSMDAVQSFGLPWGVDNGAFGGFDPVPFRRLLRRVAGRPGLLWIACPDRVGDARATLALFGQWAGEVRAAGPVAFVGQDGQEDLGVPWDDFACFFVGGSTRWKLSQAAADLMAEARGRGKLVHMGRVNSRRRLLAARQKGADSVDGSSLSRFSETHLPKFLRWLEAMDRQPLLFP